MGQMLVQGGRPAENLTRAAEMIARAAESGCDCLVLPECLDLGWTHPSALTAARTVPGEYSARLSEAARSAQMHLVAGLTERDGDRIYNSAVLLSPGGEILLKHRKINVLDIAQDIYAIGDSLSVTRTPFGVVGVNICADNFQSSLALGHCLGRMGAQFLLSPCAWAVPADHDPRTDPYCVEWKASYPLLARLYEMTVVGVSNVGEITAGVWQGRRCIGNSLAYGPDGSVLVEGPYGQGAEHLLIIEVESVDRTSQGTSIAEMLRQKGYEGP